MFKLRPALPEDQPTIRRLVRLGRINPTGLDWKRFVVAVSPEGEVIGCGQIKPHRDGTYELASLVTHPRWRGKGVARALIENLSASHPGELYLMCRSELGPFYEKFGFRIVRPEEMPRYFRRISRMVKLVEILRSEGSSLLVMKRV